MRRVLGKCSSLALLSCGIFFFIVTILFFWVINLDGQQLKTDNAIDVNAAASSIVSSIRAGSTGSHRIHSSPVSGSSSQHQYNQQVPSWMIVNPYGVQIAVADCADQECLMKLPSAMILLGSAVHPFQVSENVVNLKLFVEHPYEGWVTISSANIQTGVVTHYVRMLNTTIATADVPLENSNYCTNTTNHWIGMDHVGGDLPNQPHGAFSNPVTVNSASDCCVKCSVTLQCVRWTLVGQAECWLKGAAAALKPGDKAKHLTSGTVPAASKQQHSSPTVQGKKSSTAEALVPAHTSSVECCSETAAVLPKLGSSGPDAAVEEVLASLSMPVFDEPCPLGAVCAFSKRAVLSSTLMALLRELLACPVPVLRRTQALQGPATSMLTNPKGARVVLSMLNSKPFSMAEQVRSKNDNHGIRPVLQTNRLTADWTDQQPIGTGRFGALVGGNIRSEVIPLSVAGLFLKHPNIGEEKKYDAATFRAARENLRAGRYEAADQQMSSYIKGSLGMFQYVADLALVYSPAPISWKKEEDMTHVAAPAVAAKDGKGKHPLPKRVPNFRRPRQPGRLGLLRSMNERLTFHPLQSVTPLRQQSAPAQALAGQRQPFGDVLVSDGILDLQSGIAYTSIAERPVNAKEGQPTSKAVQDKLLRHHHREWFASAHDDVMVGSLSCKSSVTTDEACLNAALQLHREHDPELVPEIQFSAAPLTMTEAQRSKWLPNVMTGKPKPSVQAIEFAIVLSGTISVQVPTTVTTGVVVCIGNSGGAMNLSQHAMEDASSVLICNNAAHMYVVLTIQSNGNTFTTASPPSKSVAQLTSEADERVKKALDKGFVLLRRDHAREFSEKMSRVDLRLESPKSALNSRTCTASPLDHRLESFRDGCVTSSTSAAHGIVSLNQKRQEGGPRGEAVDAKLAAQLFQYGRYLLLSSASGAVANLQGLWADGPTSAWNGDYHLNINLQMAYWAADTVRLSEAMEPLRGFVQQLQRKGTEVASQMYGCTDPRAWMAHGFLDDELDGFPHGDNQWALCVSCGAWAALSIWEHLITQPFDAAVLMEVVGSLRGVALFFREYMWAEETGDEKEASSGGHSSTGTRMHTGPTTSPENSFVLLYSGASAPAPAVNQEPPPPPPSVPAEPPLDLIDSLLLGNPAASAAAAQAQAQAEAQQAQEQAQAETNKPRAPFAVRQLTFSPALDVSVLSQASKAFSLSVQWGMELMEQCGDQLEICIGANPALKGTTSADLMTFFEALSSDQHIAADFERIVSQMPPTHVDTALHDAAHNVRAHLQKVNNAAAASPQQPGAGGVAAGIAVGKGAAAAAASKHRGHGGSAHVEPEMHDFCTAEQGGCVREYYYFDLPATRSEGGEKAPGAEQANDAIMSEALDIGHRHFSALHWVYPNNFLPAIAPGAPPDANQQHEQVEKQVKRLYQSAFNTLSAKRAHGGGHTGWSSVWEAALWARLRSPEDALGAIAKFMGTFVAPNLLSLHPPLDPKGDVECGTCFGESGSMRFRRTQAKESHIKDLTQQITGRVGAASTPLMTAERLNLIEDVALPWRGMVLEDQSKFQIDGNLGYLAAVSEMLLQSHAPGIIYLLPALPVAFSGAGRLLGAQARGDVRVSLSWREGSVVAARLTFGRPHPYRTASSEGAVGVTSPNQLRIVKEAPAAPPEDSGRTGSASSEPPPCEVAGRERKEAGDQYVTTHTFRLNGQPRHRWFATTGSQLVNCVLSLCGESIADRECEDSLKILL